MAISGLIEFVYIANDYFTVVFGCEATQVITDRGPSVLSSKRVLYGAKADEKNLILNGPQNQTIY